MQRVGAVGFIEVEDTHGKGHISPHPPKVGPTIGVCVETFCRLRI